jgi:hypothetical protein
MGHQSKIIEDNFNRRQSTPKEIIWKIFDIISGGGSEKDSPQGRLAVSGSDAAFSHYCHSNLPPETGKPRLRKRRSGSSSDWCGSQKEVTTHGFAQVLFVF